MRHHQDQKYANQAAEQQAQIDQAAAAQVAQQQAAAQYAAPPPAAPAQDDMTAQLTQLATLHSQGILTDEEFDAKKKQILGI